MRMKRTGKIVITLVMVLLLVFTAACAPAVTEEEGVVVTEEEVVTPLPTEEKVNFRLWISDEVNAINFFSELWVTITQIGVQQGGESGVWIERELDPPEKVDLTELKGDNATEIWSGELNDGTYTKVFIYVSTVEGILADGEVNVKLPSEKLQISKPFEVTSGEVTEFVYDITVIEAGKSGQYILQPQIAQSGPDKDFIDVTAKGKPEDTGKPEGKGKPEEGSPPATGGDTTPPEITIIGVTEGQQYSEPVTPVISVSDDTDPNPTVVATLNGDEFTSGTEVSEVGEYELEVTAMDASGNEAELAVNFEIVEAEDTTPPEITVTGVAEGQQYSEPVTPVISVSDDTDPNPTVVATLNGDEFTSGTEVSEVGTYELIVTAVDASGNEAEVVVNFEIV